MEKKENDNAMESNDDLSGESSSQKATDEDIYFL